MKKNSDNGVSSGVGVATTLLNYGLSSDPAPAEISTAQVTSRLRINLSASAGSPVYCNQIVIAVPVGSDAPSLFAQTPAGSVNTATWTVTTQILKGSSLFGGLAADQDYASFTYNCPTAADFLISYNLVFGVFGPVNTTTGDVQIAIQETSGTSSDPATFTAKVGYIPLHKQYPQFYLHNLVATSPSAPTVPCTDFPLGAPIVLDWESNGTYFQVFQKDQPAPIYSGTATTCTISGGASRDTSFILAASVTGSPGQDTPQGGYQPIYLYDSVSVTIANPALAPSTVGVSGSLSVGGASTLAATTTGALTAASASVTGAVHGGSLSTGGNLTATGSVNLGGTNAAGLTVSGGSTLNGATVNGALTGTGWASLNSLTVSGGLSVRTAPVSLLGQGVLLAQGTSVAQQWVLARTDGFAIAQVLTPGDNGKSSFAYGYLYTAGTWFQVQGGTVGSFGAGWQDVMNNNPNVMSIPIQNGTYWSYAAGNAGGNQLDSPIQIWWFPMGAAPGTESYRTLSADEAAGRPKAPAVEFTTFIERRAARAEAFIGRLEQAFGASLENETKSELSELLQTL